MAVYSTRTVTTTRREWFVPVNTNHSEFLKAYNAAITAYREMRGLAPDDGLFDTDLWVTSDGEEITIFFTVEDK
ncbi:hypothetical protein ACFQVD_26690 [Streptosporangium amethystogenes subsp. fukuiense]|uniref:Uncharacterized protein n=1 Tax=Streptosporangium amethystogenes subsp. fukuiense TaxID=698418 RepID=A0ABW2T6L4_9ACTN